MGGDIVPAFVSRGEAGGLRLQGQRRPRHVRRATADYWRDVGTLASYHEAHLDLVSALPVFNLYNADWPIYTHARPLPPAKLVHDDQELAPQANETLLSPGVVVSGASVQRSVLSPRVFVESGAEVTDSVLLDDVVVGRGARVHRAILDKNVVIPPGAEIGVDSDADAACGLTVRDGLTVLGKGESVPESCRRRPAGRPQRSGREARGTRLTVSPGARTAG